MTLSIINSMLRGDLRRQILVTLKTEKEISLLWRDLMKATRDVDNLMAIEQALINAVEKKGLVKVSDDYQFDRDVRQGAEEARKLDMNFGENDYTRVDKKISLEGIFNPPKEAAPTDKFLHLLVKVECLHTIESLLMLVKSVHDDNVVRTYIRKLFSNITSLCKDTNDLYIRESLTQLYFEVYHTFKLVLEKSTIQSYETDFENFVFSWKGEFPEEEVEKRYNEKIKASLEIENKTTTLPQLADRPKLTTAAEKFTKIVGPYYFEELHLIKVLNQKQQAELIELMVLDACYAAAMLKYLGYFERLRSVYQKNNNEIINHCSKSLGCSASSFKKYFYSLKTSNSYTTYERHNARAFLDNNKIESDYNRIKKSY